MINRILLPMDGITGTRAPDGKDAPDQSAATAVPDDAHPTHRALRPAARLMAALSVVIFAGCASSNAVPADGPAWVAYGCESGRGVTASYPDDSTAVVRYGGATIPMRIALSASGARYTGGGYEWWTRGSGPGSTGRLGRFAGQEQTAEIALEECSVPDR